MQYCSIAVLQYCMMDGSRLCSIAVLQYCSIAILHDGWEQVVQEEKPEVGEVSFNSTLVCRCLSVSLICCCLSVSFILRCLSVSFICLCLFVSFICRCLSQQVSLSSHKLVAGVFLSWDRRCKVPKIQVIIILMIQVCVSVS